MSSRHFLFVVGARVFSPKIAVGAEFANHCADLATLRAAIKGQDGKLIKITSDQWQFLRGVYAMNVEAPPGLPDGDNAVLAQGGSNSNGQLFFVDGDKPCAPMHAPPALLSLMEQVAMADINQDMNQQDLGRPMTQAYDVCAVSADD